MLSLHLFDFAKVVALNSTNDADVPLRTYSTNQPTNQQASPMTPSTENIWIVVRNRL